MTRLGFLLLLTSCVARSQTVVDELANGVVVHDESRQISVTALSADVIRVQFSPQGKFKHEHSFAVINRDFAPTKIEIATHKEFTEVKTNALIVHVQHQPLRLEILDRKGHSLDQDDALRGYTSSATSWQLSKRLRDDEQIYGFGEKTGHLNKRGMGLGGYHYTMWNSDTYGYDSSTDPIYVSVPFYMVMRTGRAHGVFLDNSFRTTFDVGRSDPDLLTFGATGGELDYYFINGPQPKDVITRYTALTGRMPLPPRWSLGYHQSRWSYYPEARVRQLADTFRAKHIPADTLWLDIDYQEGFKPFSWDYNNFPKPKEMIVDLQMQGFHVVTIVDPHPKKEAGNAVYEQGVAGGHFVKNSDGSLFEGPVWPSGAKTNPGNSVFPDFTRAATRKWWGDLHKELLDFGVAGIWNDMNEPAVWIAPRNTMPLDVQHENDGEPTDQREIHNVYGMLHSRSTFEGIQRLRPNTRPFVLTRASFAGGQRYAAVWPGDNTADWSSLRQSLPTLMGLGISGFPFVGADIGGFAGYPSPELFTRWLQAAVFSPFMRAHTEQSTAEQDPWSFGGECEAINKRAIELRYELLPHIYNVMEQASRTGVPALRPLFLEFPNDPQTWSRDDQFMFGADILVAPVVVEGALTRSVYLPAGKWFDFWTGEEVDGGRDITVKVTLESLPIFIRSGAFLFQQPVVQYTGKMPGNTLRVAVFPAAQSSSTLYDDDGESLAYQSGEKALRLFSQQRDAQKILVDIGKISGRYRAKTRAIEIEFVQLQTLKMIFLDGKKLAYVDPLLFEKSIIGWTVRNHRIVVKWTDHPTATRLSVWL